MSRTKPVTWAKVMAGTAVLALSMAACGSSDSSTPEATDTNSPSPTESSSAPASESSAPADETFTNDKCKGNQDSSNTLRVGGILPLTGNLAYLGPPEISGVGLAVSEINAAGTDITACHDIQDSGDSTDMSISSASAQTLIASKPSVVIGAASSSVSLNVVDTFASSKVVEISPANTAIDLSGYSPWYFRTAPPDTIQGSALGQLISSDGYQKIAFIVFNDTYGTGLRDAVENTVTGAGGQCVYGCKGDGNEFPAGQTTFSTEVGAALASNPDAIVILAFDETKAIVPELKNQGWDMSKTYYSDGNTADYGKDFPKGTLEGAQGTIPGADASDEFKARLNGWSQSAEGAELQDYAYGPESYDATILSALAALKGGDTTAATIKANLAAVSGANGGTECTSFAECAAALADGDIHYMGPSGIGPFNKQNDPSSAFVGIYKYDNANKNIFSTTVEGSVE
ncbi:MAG: ABC transporter substrate-binding protein [Nocardioides sp.]